MGNCNSILTQNPQANNTLNIPPLNSTPQPPQSPSPQTPLQTRNPTPSPYPSPSQTPSPYPARFATTNAPIPVPLSLFKVLKHHLDVCHFVKIVSFNDLTNQYVLECLLCGAGNTRLEGHQGHMKDIHPYMDYQSTRNIEQQNKGYKLQSNEALKKNLTPIEKLDYIIYPDGKQAEIADELYRVDMWAGEYELSEEGEFDEGRVMGDLVWRHIFEGLDQAIFYGVQFVERGGNLVAFSKIFTKRGV